MAKSIALAPDASRLASLLLSYLPAVCAFVAPRQRGAGAAIIERLSHSRPLRGTLFPARGLGLFGLAALVSACAGVPPADARPSRVASANQSVAPAPKAALSSAASASTPAPEVVAKAATIASAPWGSVDGKEVALYTLTNEHGLFMKVATYGGIITELHVPDRNGQLADIVLGFDSLDEYRKSSPYFGAIIGRVANRIAGATFRLGSKRYALAKNNGKNSLHGGNRGWDKVLWSARPEITPSGPSLELTYTSKAGEEGYPGTVNATVTYTLSNQNELRVEMSASTDETTLINMAQHTYWNLAGHDSGTVLEQELTINAHHYTPNDPHSQTTNGEVRPVKGTPFDFSAAKAIGKDILAAGGNPIGFDGNWIVDGDPLTLRTVARARDPKSGRVLTVVGDQPGLQFYSGNYLDGSVHGKGGAVYRQYDGFCLETQKFPNSINVPAWKEAVILKPGETYRSTMIHRFTTA
jgi:aldose 1-epimerase